MVVLDALDALDRIAGPSMQVPHKQPTFGDARLGALQLRTMGLAAFGAYGTHQPRPPPVAVPPGAEKPMPPVPLPPPAVMRPGSSREVALSARLLLSPPLPQTFASK